MICHLVVGIFLALHQLSELKDNSRLNVAAVLYELINSGVVTLNLLQEQERQRQQRGVVIVDIVIMSEDSIDLAQDFLRAASDHFHSDDNTYHLPYILRDSLDTP
jgi:hypothetical protein